MALQVRPSWLAYLGGGSKFLHTRPRARFYRRGKRPSSDPQENSFSAAFRGPRGVPKTLPGVHRSKPSSPGHQVQQSLPEADTSWCKEREGSSLYSDTRYLRDLQKMENEAILFINSSGFGNSDFHKVFIYDKMYMAYCHFK